MSLTLNHLSSHSVTQHYLHAKYTYSTFTASSTVISPQVYWIYLCLNTVNNQEGIIHSSISCSVLNYPFYISSILTLALFASYAALTSFRNLQFHFCVECSIIHGISVKKQTCNKYYFSTTNIFQ